MFNYFLTYKEDGDIPLHKYFLDRQIYYILDSVIWYQIQHLNSKNDIVLFIP